jgi:hypothetical protein
MGLNVQLAAQSRNMVEKKGVEKKGAEEEEEEEEVEIWDIRRTLCQEDNNSLD